eukprot:Lankesteria_metandrocarpae@DN5184_c0_g1_i1.p1
MAADLFSSMHSGKSGASVTARLLQEVSTSVSFDVSQLNRREVPLLPVEGLWVRSLKHIVGCRGLLQLTNGNIYFQPVPNFSSKPHTQIKLLHVAHVFRRTHALTPNAVEVIAVGKSADGRTYTHKSLFLHFDNVAALNMLLKQLEILIPQAFQLQKSTCALSNMTGLWRTGRLTTFHYLGFLNCMAGRNRREFSQYPIYPWIIADYTSDSINLQNPDTFRDLSRPVGALNQSRLNLLKERMQQMPTAEKFLYGSHYATPVYVVHFLVRLFPECQLRLHGGRFDADKRMFTSLQGAWSSVTSGQASFMELIPEFYEGDFVSSSNSFLQDSLGIQIGEGPLNDVALPPWAHSNVSTFLRIMREALESEHVSARLPDWIDLIFGWKQKGQEAIRADNLFHPLSYANSTVAVNSGTCPIGVPAVQSAALKEALVSTDFGLLSTQVVEFGQCPCQLFDAPHPPRLITPSWNSNTLNDPHQGMPWYVYLSAQPDLLRLVLTPNTSNRSPTSDSASAYGGGVGGAQMYSTDHHLDHTAHQTTRFPIDHRNTVPTTPSTAPSLSNNQQTSTPPSATAFMDSARTKHQQLPQDLLGNTDLAYTATAGVTAGHYAAGSCTTVGLRNAQNFAYKYSCSVGLTEKTGPQTRTVRVIKKTEVRSPPLHLLNDFCTIQGEIGCMAGIDGNVRIYRLGDFLEGDALLRNANIHHRKKTNSLATDLTGDSPSHQVSSSVIQVPCRKICAVRRTPLTSMVSIDGSRGLFAAGSADSSISILRCDVQLTPSTEVYYERNNNRGTTDNHKSVESPQQQQQRWLARVVDCRNFHVDTVRTLTCNPHQNLIASGGVDQLVYLAKVASDSLRPVRFFDGHCASVTAASFSSSNFDNATHDSATAGKGLLLTGDARGEVLLWDCRARCMTPVHQLSAAAFARRRSPLVSNLRIVECGMRNDRITFVYDTPSCKFDEDLAVSEQFTALFKTHPSLAEALTASTPVRPALYQHSNMFSAGGVHRRSYQSVGGAVMMDLRMLNNPVSHFNSVDLTSRLRLHSVDPGAVTAGAQTDCGIVITAAATDGFANALLGGVSYHSGTSRQTNIEFCRENNGGLYVTPFVCFVNMENRQIVRCWSKENSAMRGSAFVASEDWDVTAPRKLSPVVTCGSTMCNAAVVCYGNGTMDVLQ